MKWIAGFPDNPADGLPALHGLVVVNDARTGVPLAILDAGPITAERTAAVSGTAIARWTPPTSGRAARAAIVGAGIQGRAHLPVLGHLLPGVEITINDRDTDRAAGVADAARAIPGIGAARAVRDARSAIRDADVVVTCVSFGPVCQVMTSDWFAPDALVIAVDYAMSVAADVARQAGLFLVDEAGQFRANRAAGQFDDYPDPAAILGTAIRDVTPRPARGRVLVTHLGVGLADLVFSEAILAAATTRDIGMQLPR
jgi:ornithine cyclodeaminase/alanine dehydrogenase-like protein (mu-crystallin family)